MSGTIVSAVTATTPDAEAQTRNGQKHTRVYDPTSEMILVEILNELKKMNQQLQFITDEENI